MESKWSSKTHTPGPWTVGEVWEGDKFSRQIISENGAHGFTCMPAIALGRDDGHAQANAALIASAPDLLAERDALRAEVARLRDGVSRILTAETVWAEKVRDTERQKLIREALEAVLSGEELTP